MARRDFLSDFLPIRRLIVGGVERPFARDLQFDAEAFEVEVDDSAGVATVNTIGAVVPRPLAPDYGEADDGPGSTATYTTGTLTYTSTIDTALTTLTALYSYDAGVAAAVASNGKMPICILLHGYTDGATAITTTVRNRIARKGFLALVPNMRGRSSNPGTPDDSARELQDIVDAVAAVAANGTINAVADVAKIHVIGYGAGGASAISLAAKYPGFARTIISAGGFGDYGVDLTGSYWSAAPAQQATLTTRIGNRFQSMAPYRARNANTAVATSLGLTDSGLYLLWDSADAVGVLSRDTRGALQADPSLAAQWYADESTVGSTPRWSAGYWETNADLEYAERIIANRRALSAATCAKSGTAIVNGHLVTPDFEVWTSSITDPDPRRGGTGGRVHRVLVNFDVASQQYEIGPLTGDCRVAIRRRDNGTEMVRDITNGVVLFDLSNIYGIDDVIPDAVTSFSSFWGPLDAGGDQAASGEAVASWDERSPAAANNLVTAVTVSGTPVYYALTPGGRVLVTGGAVMQCADNIDPAASARWAFAVVFLPGQINNHGIIGWGDDAATTLSNFGASVRTNGFALRVSNDAGGEWFITDVVTPDTNKFYVLMCEREGSTFRLTVNNRTTVTSSDPTGTFTGTRLSFGVIQTGGTAQFPGTISLRALARVQGRAFTAGERERLYRVAVNHWGVT